MIKIKDININYEQYGNENGENIVLLHGWGQNIKMMDPIGQGLKDKYYITNIDLPGFGESGEPTIGYTIYDYYEILDELLKSLKIKKPIVIGHSFGGRIAIVYAGKKEVKKLVLLSAPFKKSGKSASLKTKILKRVSKIGFLNKWAQKMKNKIGSVDYKNASPIMRKVLVNTINEDLEEYLKIIKCPTLLIWGELDTAVSLEDAHNAEKIIPNAGLVVYEHRSHYAYLEEINRTILILREFFK